MGLMSARHQSSHSSSVSANSGIISAGSGANPYTLSSTAYNAVTNARKLNERTFKRDRKKALSALKELEGELVVVDRLQVSASFHITA